MLLVPFALQQTTFLVLIPLGLGLFEGVIHVAGIKIHKLKKITSKHISDSEFDKAMKYLNKIVAIDPFDLSNWETKGYCHYELGQYDDAISCLDRVLEADPYSERTLLFKCKIQKKDSCCLVYDNNCNRKLTSEDAINTINVHAKFIIRTFIIVFSV